MGKGDVRREMVRQEAVKNRRPLFYVNQVGGNDELIFDGHSLGFDASGALIVRGRDFEEDFLVCESLAPERPWRPCCHVSASPEEEAFKALTLGFVTTCRSAVSHSVVLGLSGGIDSA